LALLLTTLVPASALAHALRIARPKLVGDKVVIEAYFADGTEAAKAKVEVLNAEKKVIASGDTDDKGRWRFPAPAPGKYMVEVNAGAGHRAGHPFNMPDLAEHSNAAENPPTPGTPATPPAKGDSISEGPGKEESTSAPWLKIAIGLTVIGACGGAFVLAMRLKRSGEAPR